MAETIRERIERVRRRLINVEEDKDQGDMSVLKADMARNDYHIMLNNEWAGGNLIPADEVQARIDSAVSEAVREERAAFAELYEYARQTLKATQAYSPDGEHRERAKWLMERAESIHKEPDHD